MTTTTLAEIPTPECYTLLKSYPYGRVVATRGALPLVVPVNYVVDNGDIVFRTSRDSMLAGAVNNAVVAFEVDQIDIYTHTGWSIVVTGFAEEVQPEELTQESLDLTTWAPGKYTHWIRIRPGIVAGRRLGEG